MIRTQILLTQSLYEILKMRAQAEGQSLSAIVRTNFEKSLNKKKSGREILKSMSYHAVKFQNAPKDLSTNNHYLYGFNK